MKEDTPEEKRGPKWCCRGEGKGGHWCSGCEKFWTPEEWKSFELIEKYLALKPNRDLYPSLHEEFMEEAKQCALILCDSHLYSENNSPFNTMEEWVKDSQYWQKVKDSINAL